MPEAGGGAGSARLSELEARWRVDRSPRVFLQLADELRKVGNHSRALQVLEEGLSHHPESVSGRVALGRAQLDAGDAASAAETLERALARDPAQIVASKLLIETWIRIGDSARARERLDIYRILNERDDQIDEYDRRIAAMERTERLTAVIELAGAAESDEAPATGPETLAGREPLVIASTTPAQTAPLPLLSSLGGNNGAGSAAERQVDPSPFGRIHDPVASGARILDFFRAQAVFAVGAPVPPMPSAAPAIVAAPEISALAEPGTERYSTTGYAAEVEEELLAPLALTSDDSGGPAALDAVEDTLETTAPAGAAELAESLEGAERMPIPPAPLPAPGAPSATLARLYLAQSHLGEAEAEFRRVLEVRPEDDSALEGLREVARRRTSDDTVAGWKAEAAEAISPAPPRAHRTVGLTQRKVETLRDYLERIRRGRARATRVS